MTVERRLDSTVGDLKKEIEEKTGALGRRQWLPRFREAGSRPQTIVRNSWEPLHNPARATTLSLAGAGIPPANQKLLYKGQLKDASTLQEVGCGDAPPRAGGGSWGRGAKARTGLPAA